MEGKIETYLRNGRKAATSLELIDALDASADALSEALMRMTRDGRLVLTKKGKYALPETTGLIPARAFILRSGVPIARPLDGGDDMRISRRGDLRALHGDLILVRPEHKRRSDARARCELAAVTERAHPVFTAVLRMDERKIAREPETVGRGRRRKTIYREPEIRRVLSAEPFDLRTTCEIDVEGDLKGAKVGDAVTLRVVEWPRHKTPMRAEVQRTLGAGWDVRAQLKALLDTHNLRDEFPDDALEQAGRFPEEISDDDRRGRADARNVVLFTIDGEDAKDFDDAVSLSRNEDGSRLLGVHIADVSHYVTAQSPIDREARLRGTSVYLPGMTVPMLPEALSNRLCSLMPDVDRLAFSLWLTVDEGEVVDVRLERTVIRSRARLTYEQVNRLFDGEESDVPSDLRETLRNMLDLSRILREKRHARGAIDFNLAEPQFTLDENGMPTDVRARIRGDAERLIEDFMLLANETVARMTRTRRLPSLYRVHEPPDVERLRSLELFLNNVNRSYRLGSNPSPALVQRLLEETAELPEAETVRQMTLRSLKRACYSNLPEGHFGLAAADYCHFTSPIRRYPDLVVHRQLGLMLSGRMDDARRGKDSMAELAAQSSVCEFEAASAERDADDLVRAHYMKKHVGEEFEGVVSGVTGWGFYVTLPNTVEGLVHIRTLNDDYDFDADKQILSVGNGRITVRLGDRARVKLESVNATACEIDFSLIRKDKGKKDKKTRRR